MIRHVISTTFTVAAVVAVPLALTVSASAAGGWNAADLNISAQADASANAASAPFGYESDLDGQGPVARVVYRTAQGHIEELNNQPGRAWIAADLNDLTGAPAAASAPFGYQTDLDGQGRVARVIYQTKQGHIEELSLAPGRSWIAVDLNDNAKAPALADAASAPFGYQTDLDGQGKVARVVYRTKAGHIEELSDQPGRAWIAADLNKIAKTKAAANAVSAPFGYETQLNGQAHIARVVYRTKAGHIEELFVKAGKQWSGGDLSTSAKAPAAANAVSAPFGYETVLHGQDPVARVVYRTKGNHIEELNEQPGRRWIAADLNNVAGVPASGNAGSAAFAYITMLDGQATFGRVVYRTTSGHIEELNLS